MARTMYEELGDFTMTELLGRLEDVTAAQCAVALFGAGERRGNFAQSIEGAANRIRREQLRNETAELRRAVNASDERSDESDLQTLALGDLVRQHRHFLPNKGRRMRDAAPGV